MAADAGALDQARRLYQQTRYEQAVKLLSRQRSAEALALLGKAHYGLEDYKEAIKALERAVAAEPDNAHYWNWLGKAYGRRAETGSFLSAPGAASKCRKAFEKAVELAPDCIEAINDLFSYYLDAPGFLGGGKDKAATLAERVKPLDEAEYEYLQAQLARKREDFGAAERHFRRALGLEPKRVGRHLDLAAFLSEQGRYEESDRQFDEAGKLAPDAPKVLFSRAKAFIRAGRNLDEARELLRRYLEAELTPEDPPRPEARRLLERM